MKKVKVICHVRNMLSPRSTVETCIELPVKDELADDLVQPVPSIHADNALHLLGTICDALALLQGYDDARIVDIRYAKQEDGTEVNT